MGCVEGWEYHEDDINGTCPKCGVDTADGTAVVGCDYSPCVCDKCGSRPCDDLC